MSRQSPVVHWKLPATALVALLVAVSCSRKAEEPAAAEPEWLARVNGKLITETDVRFEIERRKAANRPVGEVSDILQELVRREAMLAEAARSPVMNDPAVQRELENRKLGQWLDRSLQVQRDAVVVNDDELRAHYEANIAAFTRPAFTRLAMLYRRVNARDPQEPAGSVLEAISQARAAYLANPETATQGGKLTGFGTIAAEHSEDTISRYRGGDLGWQEGTGSVARVPAEVLAAGFALEVGGVSEVMAAGDGLYVVMKSGVREAEVAPFETVAPTLRRRLIREKQEAVEQAFISNVLARATIEIDEAKAARVALPAPETPEPPTLKPVTEWSPVRNPPAP